MPRKTLIILIVILMVGVGLVFYLQKERGGSEKIVPAVIPSFNRAEVDTVRIKSGEGEFELVKTSAGWQVNEKVAESSKIDSLFESLTEVKVTGPISTSGQYDQKFNLDEASRTELTLLKGDEIVLHLFIGKAGSTFGTTYFKQPDSQNVYLADKNWNTAIYKKIDDWRDKTVWAFAENEVKKITAKRGWRKYEAQKIDGKWQLTYAGQTKEMDLDSSLNKLVATGFETEEKKLPDSLVFYGEEDKELASFQVSKDDSNYYLKRSDSEEVYRVSQSTFEKVWLPVVFESEE